MYFIYKKQINVASEYSYNVDSIVEWFKDYIHSLIEAYLSSLGLIFGDINWDDGLDTLYDECVDYLND